MDRLDVGERDRLAALMIRICDIVDVFKGIYLKDTHFLQNIDVGGKNSFGNYAITKELHWGC